MSLRGGRCLSQGHELQLAREEFSAQGSTLIHRVSLKSPPKAPVSSDRSYCYCLLFIDEETEAPVGQRVTQVVAMEAGFELGHVDSRVK